MKQAVSANLRAKQNDPQTIAARTWFETAFPTIPTVDRRTARSTR